MIYCIFNVMTLDVLLCLTDLLRLSEWFSHMAAPSKGMTNTSYLGPLQGIPSLAVKPTVQPDTFNIQDFSKHKNLLRSTELCRLVDISNHFNKYFILWSSIVLTVDNGFKKNTWATHSRSHSILWMNWASHAAVLALEDPVVPGCCPEDNLATKIGLELVRLTHWLTQNVRHKRCLIHFKIVYEWP